MYNSTIFGIIRLFKNTFFKFDNLEILFFISTFIEYSISYYQKKKYDCND